MRHPTSVRDQRQLGGVRGPMPGHAQVRRDPLRVRLAVRRTGLRQELDAAPASLVARRRG